MLPKGRYFFHTRPSIAKYFHIIYMVFLISSIPPHIMSVRRLRTWGWVCEVSSLVFQKGICAFFSFCRFYRMLLLIYVICVKNMWFFSYLVFVFITLWGGFNGGRSQKGPKWGIVSPFPGDSTPIFNTTTITTTTTTTTTTTLCLFCVTPVWHSSSSMQYARQHDTLHQKQTDSLCSNTRNIHLFLYISRQKFLCGYLHYS